MIEQKEFANGFRYLEISNSRAWARIALQGAHLFHYERPGKEPLLWLSRASLFAEGRAIRGGVPVCWPWFGRHPDNPDLPQHGFARTSLWRLVEVDESDPDLSVVTLELQDCAQTLELWPHHFILRLRIGVGRSLELALTTMNRDRESCTITSALHSYFTVSDIDNVEIRGLENTPCS
jgi:glucose-6-phosphate 1-epimerase